MASHNLGKPFAEKDEQADAARAWAWSMTDGEKAMLRRIVKKAVQSLGYRIERDDVPPPDDLLPFLRQLWPVSIDIPLVRFGGDADGAYLLPNDLDGVTALFSPGVEAVALFESDMAKKGMTCYMADASVAAPPISNPAFRFEPKFLGLRDDRQFMTIDAWVNACEPGNGDLILQMDIEGAEWTVLSSISDPLLHRFRIIVLEVHSLGQLLDQYGKQIIMEVLNRLLATHYLVHNHPNNWGRLFRRRGVEVPDVMEMTFLRKDRATPSEYAHVFPNPIDIVNGSHLPLMPLPAAWYASSEEALQRFPPV